jgi:VWFA-related protein
LFLLLIISILPVTLGLMQGAPAPRLEITGVNASALPAVTVTANVYDNVNQPITNLTTANFALIGELAQFGQIVSVENITDQNLPIATVLVIDISTSMEGAPYFAARDAARAFVQNVGANDPVAIVIFSTGVTLYQPYTTDKNVLLSAIDALPLGGETALYQASYEGVQLAAEAPVPRRAVVLLSDGAEYGGESAVGRGAALEEAVVRGVPVYTIGLGYGTDRTYLQELAYGTNARYYESPAPDQLVPIYSEIATILRSQYVITLNLDVPADGTTYTLGLQVTTDGGTSTADAALRTPIPVPIIDLPLPTEPITAPTTITANVRADDDIQGVNFNIADTEIGALLDAEPYTFTIDPAQFTPGTYTLAVSALDSTGDVGTVSGAFTIAALPPALIFTPDITALGTLTEPVTVTVDAGGQTPVTGVSVSFDDGAPQPLEAPYSFIVDPAQFSPGEHRVTVTAANEGGQNTSVSGTFTAAALPPAIAISGLQDGQSVDRPVDVRVTVQGQVPVSQTTVTVGGLTLEPDAEGVYRVDPMAFPPGGTTLTVNATLENGQSGSARLNFLVAALPPRIVVSGLTAGETLTANREIEINAESQTTVVHVAVFIDEAEIGHFMSVPVPLVLDVLALGAGDHTLRLVADNASGQSATLDVPFRISDAPIATATEFANATATSVQATQYVQATAAAVQATEFANVTATQAQATSNAVSTANAQATLVIEATATQAAAVTATEQANATATQLSFLQITQQIAAEQTSTQAAFNAQGTFVARSTLDAAATEFSQATSTQVAEVTRSALMTGTAQAGATGTAAITATQAANDAATATQAANEVGATATQAAANAGATATQAANEAGATATQAAANAGATATQAANASATEQANATATQGAIQTQSAVQTDVAQEALRDQAATATEIAGATATEAANVTATEQARATATQAANASATASAEAAAATQAFNATSTQASVITATAQTTADARETARALIAATLQMQTRSALETRAAQTRLEVQATQAARATRDTLATETQAANAANATATQAANDANATATQAAATQNAAQTVTQVAAEVNATRTQQVIDAARATATQMIRDVTATNAAIQTQNAVQTDTAQSALIAQAATATEIIANATETQAANLTATALSQEATATQAAVIQNVTEAARAVGATQTGEAAATERAAALGTQNAATATSAQATAENNATGTSIAQATIEIRLSAVGPTATPLSGEEQGAPTATSSGSPEPTMTLVPVEAETTPTSSSIIPLLILALVVIILLAVAYLVLRRR